ncbi:MAG: energy transducer TonB [Fidelibacterota bacterium]|nr:MAG: energy transducer TonB [Candidatus Neomarinimicrobiota bacterium]
MAIHPDNLAEQYPLRMRLIAAAILLLIAVIFFTFPRFRKEEAAQEHSFEAVIETINIPATRQFKIPPPPPRPAIPIESEYEDFAEDITIVETELESFAWNLPPPDPEVGPTIATAFYDEPAEPLGGYAAIGKNAHYPNIAKAAGIEGKVIVEAFVDLNGRVTETVILEDIPNSGFGRSASAAIKGTRFNPARRRGEPVASWITIPVRFILKN